MPTTKTVRLPAPTDREARAYFIGWLGATLDRKRTISVTDWNDAVRAAEEDLAG
jgi:hypothetical protein